MARIKSKPLSEFNLTGTNHVPVDESGYLSAEVVAIRKTQLKEIEKANFIRSLWMASFKLSAGLFAFLCIGFTVNWGIKNYALSSHFMYLTTYSTVGSGLLGGFLMLAYLIAYALPTFIALYFVYVIYRETKIMVAEKIEAGKSKSLKAANDKTIESPSGERL